MQNFFPRADSLKNPAFDRDKSMRSGILRRYPTSVCEEKDEAEALVVTRSASPMQCKKKKAATASKRSNDVSASRSPFAFFLRNEQMPLSGPFLPLSARVKQRKRKRNTYECKEKGEEREVFHFFSWMLFLTNGFFFLDGERYKQCEGRKKKVRKKKSEEKKKRETKRLFFRLGRKVHRFFLLFFFLNPERPRFSVFFFFSFVFRFYINTPRARLLPSFTSRRPRPTARRPRPPRLLCSL